MEAVQFDRYGDEDVLEVREVPRPEPESGRVVVQVRAAAVNPGEIAIREGVMAERWPTTFPSGEGSDLAGVVVGLGEDVSGFAEGDAVMGWTDERASHADYVAVPADHLARKPDALPWEIAGSLFVAPMAAMAAIEAIAPQPGETVVVAGATGGVGGVAAQLAVQRGARTIGIASERNHDWLRSRGVIPVAYGDEDEQVRQIREAAPDGVDAFADVFGGGYVELAITRLGVSPQRVSTVIDYVAAQRLGATATGSSQIVSPERIEQLAELVLDGAVEIPIQHVYPLAQVRDAYRELSSRHTRGKIVLVP
jgi:NADPH:quinone reductase-like Zn-dependent oxidoreductase